MASRVSDQSRQQQTLNRSKESESIRVYVNSPSPNYLSSEPLPGESSKLLMLSDSAPVRPVPVSRSHSENEKHQDKLQQSASLKKQKEELPKTGKKDEAHGGNGQKEKMKLAFAISLSRREIEEDIYSRTGSRPNRRPKKRPNKVQKQLDGQDAF